MKKGLMKYLICPDCNNDFQLEIYIEVNGEIEEGKLYCINCNKSFPIINGIPRILPENLLNELVTGYQEFVEKYGNNKNFDSNLKSYNTDKIIAKGFEFEWKNHSKVLPEHEKEFLHVINEVLTPDDFNEKLVLDAGCGQGRFSFFAQKYGAKEIISFDLGEQVLISKKNLSDKSNIHLVQASIYNPPFKPLFNLIMSIGVIHHLPNPEEGFKKLFTRLNNNGIIFIWVYGYSSIIPVIKFLRKITLNFGTKTNRILALPFAVLLYAIILVYNLVKLIPGLKRFADLIPFNMYYDRGFSNIWTICFDKINSHLAVYYKREDLEGWLGRLPECSKKILSERYPGKSGSSWRLMVKK